MLIKPMLDNFHEQLSDLDNEETDDYLHVVGGKYTVEQIKRLEEKIHCSYPVDLAAMLTAEGTVKHESFGNTWNTLKLDSFEYLDKHDFGLIQYIDYVWGGRYEFNDSKCYAYLTKADQAYLNANYFVFGFRYVDDNVHVYFYFDKAGKFGIFEFDQDMQQGLKTELKQLIAKSPAAMTLEELLDEQFDAIITAVSED